MAVATSTSEFQRIASRWRLNRSEIGQCLGLAAVYFVAAKLALQLAFVHESATPVWPPTGIAIAALLVRGPWLWPGITLGALLANALTAGTVWTSFGIAIGNTLESVVAVHLVQQFARGRRTFEQPRDVLRFLVLAGFLSTAISPSLGITSLCLGGQAAWADFVGIWWTWWLGDMSGAIVVGPSLVLWLSRGGTSWIPRRPVEALLVTLATVATAAVVFGVGPRLGESTLPLAFLCVPPLIWAAFRFGRRGASTLVLLLSAVAIAGTLGGSGPFALHSSNTSLLLLQAYLGTLSSMVLLLSAVVAQRQKALKSLQALSAALEERVEQRTHELTRSVRSLQREIAVRRNMQAQLVESERNLARAQALSHLGSWSWDCATNQVVWSDELFRILGLEPGDERLDYACFLERVHPEDRAFVDETIRRASRTGEPFGFEHRIVRPDGAVRWLHGLGEVLSNATASRKLHGTASDITERKQFEIERRQLEFELLELNYREQSQLGYHLQNDLGQLLTGVAFLAKRVETDLVTRQAPQAPHMSEIRSLVKLAIEKTRSLARVLVSASVADESLPIALRKLAANTEKLFAISCQVQEGTAVVPVVDALMVANLYRIAQESISNAVRHGKANRIVIRLEAEPRGGLTLVIEDNGAGFDCESIASDGLGLPIMRQRAKLIGGQLDIQSAETGTVVLCDIHSAPPTSTRHGG